MGLNFKKGSFVTVASTATTSVSGLGFQPKIVIIFCSNVGFSGTDGYQSHQTHSIAFKAVTGEGGAYGGCLHNSSSANGVQYTPVNTESVILGTADGLNNRGSLAIDSDGFTITWIPGNIAQVTEFQYIAIAGSDITDAEVQVGNWTGTGSKSITGLSFQPDFAMFLHCGNSDGTYFGTFSIGAAKSSTNRWACAVSSLGGASMSGNMWSKQNQRTDSIILGMKNTTAVTRVDFTSFNSDGLTVNVITNTHNSINYVVLMIKSGGRIDMGAYNKVTNTNGSDTITPSFTSATPKGLFLCTFGRGLNATIQGNSRISFGASDGTTEGCIWSGSNDGVTPSVAASRFVKTKCLSISAPASTTSAECDVTVGASTYTVTWTTNDSLGEQILWIGFGGTAGAQNVSITASATGTYSLVRSVGIIDTFSATGSASVLKTFFRSITASATGSLALAALRILIQAIAASSTGSVALIRTVGKNSSASASGTFSLSRSVGLIRTFSSTGSPTLSRVVSLTRSFSSTVSFVFAKSLVKIITASATGSLAMTRLRTLLASVTASSTGTSSLTKSVGKRITASATGSASPSRSVGKNITASGTGTASITASRVFLVNIAVSCLVTYSLIRSVGRRLSMSSTGTFSLTTLRRLLKSITASGTGSYTVSRSVARTMTFSGTGSASLTAIRVVLKTISATASGAFALIRSVGKSVPASSTGTASVATSRRLNKTISATGTGSFVYVRTVTRALAYTATGSATVSAVKSVVKIIAVASSATVSMARSVGRVMSFSGSGSFTLTRSVGRRMSFSCTGTATVDASHLVAVLISAVATGSVSLLRGLERTLSATATGAVAVSTTRAFAREIAVQAVGTFSYIRSISKTISVTSIVDFLISVIRGDIRVHPGNIAYVPADSNECVVGTDLMEASSGEADPIFESVVEIDVTECGVPNESREIKA